MCWVGGYYFDEFVDYYVKIIVVCEVIGVGLFLAGVGCVFEWDMFDCVVEICGGVLFDVDSLIEDYELGLWIG